MSAIPEVLVFGSVNDTSLARPYLDLSRSFGRNVHETLSAVGLGYRMVDTAEPLPAMGELLELATGGIVLLGGGDVDPTSYGHHEPVANLYGVHPEIDAAALALIREAIDRQTPILAICRGAQLVNVALGGTLVPDIENWHIHRGATPDTVFVEERVRLDTTSKLAGILEVDELTVMNGHHQAIDRLGAGVVCTGRADDGIIESIEVDDRWIIGVQWHPEHDKADRNLRLRLFAAFADAVAAHAERIKGDV
ncbi:gamma-glutamyl-gamma-aminobutyrate hydrolase family protein [Leucobacter sp. Z1108]|uniref:gamma-glutamyl-gamma-aminobutyrate hydrolase family protein n=1 Tax=Leucobacter sp. Z1108 TaxID=3439066 RepID=UPI003F3195B6